MPLAALAWQLDLHELKGPDAAARAAGLVVSPRPGDAFDAMTARSTYRERVSCEQVVEAFRRLAERGLVEVESDETAAEPEPARVG